MSDRHCIPSQSSCNMHRYNTRLWLPVPKLLTMHAVHLLHRKPYLLEPPQCTSEGWLPAWLPDCACQLLRSAAAALYNAQLPTTSQVPASGWLPFNIVLGLSTLFWAFRQLFWAFQHCDGLQPSKRLYDWQAQHCMPLVTSFATAVQTPCMIPVHVTCWPSFSMLISGARLSYDSWWNDARQDETRF